VTASATHGASRQADRHTQSTPGGTRWFTWILGGGLVAAVVIGALQFSEERAFIRLMERVQPWWLGAAILPQAATYAAQGWIWQRVAVAAGLRLDPPAAFQLSLAKLFADQALPSGGLSSTVLVTRLLQRRGWPGPIARAAAVVNIASYHLAYIAALVAAMIFAGLRGYASAVVLTCTALFLIFAIGISVAALTIPGRPLLRDRLAGVPGLAKLFGFVASADARLVRNPRIVAETSALQAVIVLLDVATMWTLIRAVGAHAPLGGVFTSFMVASLFRTVGVLPGGLGSFEASSVLMLRAIGVDVATALSATLLFRGLSFWLPMLPGYWFSRRALGRPQRAS
jgi:uncharacterized membrane protein YbhN (UPF0104 family)